MHPSRFYHSLHRSHLLPIQLPVTLVVFECFSAVPHTWHGLHRLHRGDLRRFICSFYSMAFSSRLPIVHRRGISESSTSQSRPLSTFTMPIHSPLDKSALPLACSSEPEIQVPPVRTCYARSAPTSPPSPIYTAAPRKPSPPPTPSTDAHVAALTAALNRLAIPSLQMTPRRISMPFRGDPVAPVFSGTDSDLLRFFNGVLTLGLAAGLTEAELIRWATYYASQDEAELWASLPESAGDDWQCFQLAVLQFYPGVSEDHNNAFVNLIALTNERSKRSVESKVELGVFHRSFLRSFNFLLKCGWQGVDQASRMYLGAFSGEFRDRLDSCLNRRYPHRHPDKPYAIGDVYATARYVFDFLPASATPSKAQQLPSPFLHKNCFFCGDPSHLIRHCPVMEEYLQTCRCIRGTDGRIRMPNGDLALPGETLVRLKERLDAHAQLTMNRMGAM